MKAICVGDLHGDIELYRQIKSRFADDKLILVGDLLDSWYQGINEQFKLLLEVLEDIETGRTRSIIGNHDLSYLWRDRSRNCPGIDVSLFAKCMPIKSKALNLLENFIWDEENKILITHAGMSANWFNKWARAGETYRAGFTIDQWLRSMLRDTPYAYDRGHARGGDSLYGGIFWCDYWAEFLPVEGVNQIFGHTNLKNGGIHQYRDSFNYNIDCLSSRVKRQVLKLEEQKVEIIDL